MTFARLSIQEIEILQNKKCSGLEWSIYAVISSHIHSVKKNTAYPSIRRIQSLLGDNPPKIQNIVRAISRMVKKGILQKGKVRSKSRFTLHHRPIIRATKKLINHAKTFVSRYTPSSLSNAIYNKSNRVEETNHFGYHKREPLKGTIKSISKRMDNLWIQICPIGLNERIRIERIEEDKKIMFLEWVKTSGDDRANDIYETYTEQIENFSRGIGHGA